MMENKKIIKQDGITYYFDGSRCYDIDIEPWVTDMKFIAELDFAYPDYQLRNVMKQFPNIKTLTIDNEVFSIYISNFMFPNVKQVISKNYAYVSGKYLIRKGTLLNTFCCSENDILDMSCVTDIDKYAFAGCRSLNITNVNERLEYESLAFAGSMFAIKPLSDNRMRFVGGISVNTVTDSDTVVIQDDLEEVTGVCLSKNELDGKTLIVHRVETLALIRSDICLEKLIIKADVNVSDLYAIFNMPNVKSVGLDTHNPYCKIIDSVVYSKNGKVLHRCLKQRTGTVIIPDGVEIISSSAFTDCENISAVVIPDSVNTIGEYAFYRCDSLKSIKCSSNSIKVIPDYCFARCEKLESVECGENITSIGKSAFINCYSLRTIFSLKNCHVIHNNAFTYCYNLTTLHITKDTFLDDYSIPNITNVYLESIDKKHLSMILKAVMPVNTAGYYDVTIMENNHKGSSVLNIFVDDKHICIPRYMSRKAWKCINEDPQELFDSEDSEFAIFQSISEASERQELLLTAYSHKKSPLYENYLKRTAKAIATRRIKANDEDGLMEVLNYNWLSGKALGELLPSMQEAKMHIAIAYVLDKKNKKEESKNSFRL